MAFIWLGGVAFFLLGFVFWRKAIVFSLVWVIFVGAVRKWLFPDVHEFIFFSTNLILFGSYSKFFILQKRFPRHKINPLIGFLFFWGLIEMFNPNIPNILIGVLGLIIYFSYIPMAYMLPYVFETKEKLLSFLKFYSILAIPILFLGVIQFFSPAGALINRYVREDVGVAAFGESLRHARVCGTFSYISGYATYLGFMMLILIYLVTIRKFSKKISVILYLLISLCVINLFMTGSRGTVWWTAISIIIYILLSGVTEVSYLIKKLVPRIIILCVGICLIIMMTNVGKTSYQAFMKRAGGKDVVWRIKDALLPPLKILQQAGIFGYGIGTQYQGASYIVKDESKWGDISRGGEIEPMRILLELGLAGYFFVYLIRFLVIKYFWNLSKRLVDRDLKLLCLIAIASQLQYLHFGNLVFNSIAGIYYWFSVGFLFMLPRIDEYN